MGAKTASLLFIRLDVFAPTSLVVLRTGNVGVLPSTALARNAAKLVYLTIHTQAHGLDRGAHERALLFLPSFVLAAFACAVHKHGRTVVAVHM